MRCLGMLSGGVMAGIVVLKFIHYLALFLAGGIGVGGAVIQSMHVNANAASSTRGQGVASSGADRPWRACCSLAYRDRSGPCHLWDARPWFGLLCQTSGGGAFAGGISCGKSSSAQIDAGGDTAECRFHEKNADAQPWCTCACSRRHCHHDDNVTNPCRIAGLAGAAKQTPGMAHPTSQHGPVAAYPRPAPDLMR